MGLSALQEAISGAQQKAKTVDEWLNTVDYRPKVLYVPSEFAMTMVTMIKMIHGVEGTQNLTPEVHLKVLDNFVTDKQYVVNMMHRGFGKSTLIKYLFFYMAIYGELPNFGSVTFAMYISDSMDNGISVMRKDLEYTWDNSEYLQKVLPQKKFVEDRWEFSNEDGKEFVIRGYGAKSGVRGTREKGFRPQIAVLDDLLSDDDARSPTVLRAVKDTVYRAIDMALDPNMHKVFWMGTPFHAGDPLYEAVESGYWEVNLYPVCEEFPVEREDFRGSWEDRFTYDYVLQKYLKALSTGEVSSFNQELMLRIMSDDDRLILDTDIRKFNLAELMRNKHMLNFYITTDIATTEKQSADYSVVDVWAVNSTQDRFWVDGICERQTIDKTFNDIFRLVREYKPQSVGIEVSGQQSGLLSLLENEMSRRNSYFHLASNGNNSRPGIRPVTNKLQRFNNVVPLFKSGKFFFPTQAKDAKAQKCLQEHLHEILLACVGGFKSKHDDAIDAVSMLSAMSIFYPDDDVDTELVNGVYRIRQNYGEVDTSINSYIV